MRWTRRWLPVIGWAALIWIFSTSWFTSEDSSRWILPILRWLLPSASLATLIAFHNLIRKTAHVVEYFIFSLLNLRAIRGERRGARLGWALAALAVVGAYAALDEFHQSFVPGRTASPWDVLLDTSGGVLAQALVVLLALWKDERERLTAGEEGVAPAARAPQD